MDINILRSKTPDMALKELVVALATYNLIRKVIYASIKDLPFSPKEDFIFKFYTLNQDILVDKKGRVYNRWSTGRRRNEAVDNTTDAAEKKTLQKI
jgi:allantoicase